MGRRKHKTAEGGISLLPLFVWVGKEEKQSVNVPDVSVVIVNWNTKSLLGQCLASVEAGLEAEHRAEVWVVDNASSDGSADMVRAEFPDVHLIANRDNKGFARANNQALAQATGRYLLLLNSDCKVLDGAISALARFLDEHPQAGIAGCRLLNADGTVQRSAWRAFPTLASVVIGGLWLDKLPVIKGKLAREERELAQTQKPVPVAHLLGACLLVRRGAMDAAGLLDDTYFMYLEETDWCRRIAAQNFSVWYVPSHAIIHYGQQSAALAPDKATADWCRSMCRFYRQTYAPKAATMALLKAAIGASVTLRFLVARARRKGASRPTWAGTASTLRALRHA